jgi:hypothetical protein
MEKGFVSYLLWITYYADTWLRLAPTLLSLSLKTSCQRSRHMIACFDVYICIGISTYATNK